MAQECPQCGLFHPSIVSRCDCGYDLVTRLNRLKEIHRYCSEHRQQVKNSARCGCLYCGAIFPSTEIDLWVGGQDGVGEDGTTAFCPRCGIDSVLPDNIPGVELTPELLNEM